MSRTFVYRRRIEFADTDMAGVMHFSSYYRIMEEAEHAFWRSFNMSVISEVDGRTISWPRVATSCEYHDSARFEDELDVELTVAKVGAKSATYGIDFQRDGRCLAKGRSTAVCCTIANGVFEAVTIPDVLRAKLVGAAPTG